MHAPLMQLPPQRGTYLPHSNEDKGVELFYAPSESIFAAVASEMVALGWSVFPQSSEGRLPATVYGEMIRWGALRDVRPDAATIAKWKTHCGTSNVACVFGPASNHTFAIDIDVLDEAIVERVVALADEILGYTPLRREGRAPKVALIFRHAADDVVRSVVRTLAVDGDKAMVEVQGAGKTLTFHGKHHKTGRYFKWLDDSPIIDGPETATLVTSAQVDRFFAAVEQAYGFASAPSVASTGTFTGALGNLDGLRITTMSETGVASGRWQLTNSIVFATVRANSDRVYDAISRGPEAIAECNASLVQAALATWHQTAVLGGRWSEAFLTKTITANTRNTVASVQSGRLNFRPPRTPCLPPAKPKEFRSMYAGLANVNALRRRRPTNPTNMPTGTAPCRK